MPAWLALALGILIALAFGNPLQHQTSKWTPKILAYSIIGLGAGMNLETVLETGASGFWYTLISIALTIAIGIFLARQMAIPRKCGLLVTIGTAICGGSAIAAVAPVIRAKNNDISLSLIAVFSLNSIALFIFPSIGHWLGFSESQFGLWAALAIHDTSSVVGASMQYGPQALEIATTIKLVRALWIFPVVWFIDVFLKCYVAAEDDTEEADTRGKRPWFIFGFLLMAALVTYIPSLQTMGNYIDFGGRRLLVGSLFLIGLGMAKQKPSGRDGSVYRVMGQALILWVLVSTLSAIAIKLGLIHL